MVLCNFGVALLPPTSLIFHFVGIRWLNGITDFFIAGSKRLFFLLKMLKRQPPILTNHAPFSLVYWLNRKIPLPLFFFTQTHTFGLAMHLLQLLDLFSDLDWGFGDLASVGFALEALIFLSGLVGQESIHRCLVIYMISWVCKSYKVLKLILVVLSSRV